MITKDNYYFFIYKDNYYINYFNYTYIIYYYFEIRNFLISYYIYNCMHQL